MAENIVMRQAPHGRTWIAIIRDHLDAWRRENHWSRETLVQQIVDAHERLGFERLTGLRFEPGTTDAFGRMKINAERVYRWLDDHSKDKNLLGANLLPSILAGLPLDRRLALADELLRTVDLGARELDVVGAMHEEETAAILHFRDVTRATAATQEALADLTDGIKPGEPEKAQARIGLAMKVLTKARAFVDRLQQRRRRA